MSDLTIEFGGETFRTASKVALMPLMKFAHLARKGVDADDMEGLAAIYDLIRATIADDEWARFEQVATDTRAETEELLGVARQAIEVISARPTNEPSDSSHGQPSTKAPSADGSSSQVIARLEERGRPDLALIVDQAQRSGATA